MQLHIRIGGYGCGPFVSPRLKAAHGVDSMPETADNVPEDFGVSCADQDAGADDLIPALADETPHVNPNGGAIAIGHPLGMCGGRLVTTVAYQLHRHSRARLTEESPCMRKW